MRSKLMANARDSVVSEYQLHASDKLLQEERVRDPSLADLDDDKLRARLCAERVEELIGTIDEPSTFFIMRGSVRDV